MNKVERSIWLQVIALTVVCGMAWYVVAEAQGQAAPRYQYDPGWPKPLPNKWKIGGVTGLAVARDDTVWVYNRPNDLTNLELEAEIRVSDCCVRPPSMVQLDKDGTVIGSFDAPQGHGMDIDSKGFAYLGQNTVRKYDTKTGKLVGEIAHIPETRRRRRQSAGRDPNPSSGTSAVQDRSPGFSPPPGAGAAAAATRIRLLRPRRRRPSARSIRRSTPMIVGGIEEIRIDEPANEVYVADNYLGGRVLVFDLTTFAFKRGWGAYGHRLADISTNDADHEYVGTTPPKEFRGHLTLNVSNDGLVYAADRAADRIHVTTKDGKFVKEFIITPPGTSVARRRTVAPPAAWPSRRTRRSGTSTSPTSRTTRSGS